MPWEDFKQLYWNAWNSGCKGLSTFNVGGKRMGILTEKKASDSRANVIVDDEQELVQSEGEALKEGMACSYDPTTGERSCG
jgi:ribonucleoside-diphosphate reductase alpha chain